MASYHLSVKTISRSHGRSATAAAAYRSASKIVDERTGSVHDYERRTGVESTTLVLPEGSPDWANNRQDLWNAAEKCELRKNSTVAREFEVALPSELEPEQRRALAGEFGRELADRHGVAVDVCIHEPGREGDSRNFHAHILTSTRRLGPDGFHEKARELDDLKTGPAHVHAWRERWAELSNEALEKSGSSERVDHRSLRDQREEALTLGDDVRAQVLDREPTKHLGPVATEYERRTGQPSYLRQAHMEEANARLLEAKRQGEIERSSGPPKKDEIVLSSDVAAAVKSRDSQPVPGGFYESMKVRATARDDDQRTARVDKVISTLGDHASLREGKAAGYEDGGSRWSALPPELRSSIDALSKRPPEQREQILDGIRERMQTDPGQLDAIEKKMGEAAPKEQPQNMPDKPTEKPSFYDQAKAKVEQQREHKPPEPDRER